MLKRTILALCALLAVLLGSSGVAGAQVSAAASNNCNYWNGEVGAIVEPAHVISWEGEPVGAVQLCKDSQNRYWGYIVFKESLVGEEWGNAYLNRYWDGVRLSSFDCDSAGGNKRVIKGQTRCWTPKIFGDNYRWTWQVIGIQHVGPTRVAFGKTAGPTR